MPSGKGWMAGGLCAQLVREGGGEDGFADAAHALDADGGAGADEADHGGAGAERDSQRRGGAREQQALEVGQGGRAGKILGRERGDADGARG